MALATGTRLGAYEITDQIGVGGMGEVYRATDKNLKRDVAIKVLPEAFVETPIASPVSRRSEMGKKSTLSIEQRVQLVLRLLSKEAAGDTHEVDTWKHYETIVRGRLSSALIAATSNRVSRPMAGPWRTLTSLQTSSKTHNDRSGSCDTFVVIEIHLLLNLPTQASTAGQEDS